MPVLPKDLREMVFSRYSSYSLSTDNRSNGSTQKLSESYYSASNSKENHLSNGPKRAVSMTRLDQLAKPRQRYLEESLRLRGFGKHPTKTTLLSIEVTLSAPFSLMPCYFYR